jgi:hypothetical protein
LLGQGLVDTEFQARWNEIIDHANANLAWCYTHAEPRYPEPVATSPGDAR